MILRLLTFTSLALFVIAAPAQAAKGNKGKKGAHAGRVLARFDRDHNGTIDGAEVAHVQAVYAALAALDTDKNGVLSESEIAAAKIPAGGKGGKKKKTQ
jgi:hypothetical protein